MNRLVAVAAFGLLMSSAIGATGGEDKKTVLTGKDDGRKIKLAKDATLVVHLEGTAGTGFAWMIAKNNADVLKPQGEPKVLAGEGKKVGGARTWEFTLKAVGAGSSELVLEYKRPFEKDKPAAKTFKATITVP